LTEAAGTPIAATEAEPNEAQMVTALKGGDESAFAWLVERHHATLVRLASRYVDDVPTAQEVAQDTRARRERRSRPFSDA
jgi:DNA-directed RNA polymerase specialized sigma24 family protein